MKDFLPCLANQSPRLIRFVCGLDGRGSDRPSLHPLCISRDPHQHRRPLDTDQSPHQLPTSCLSLGPHVSPASLSPAVATSSGPPAGLPPHSNYSPSPAVPGPSLCDPGGVTESVGSEVVLPTPTPGISQKSVHLKARGPARPSLIQGRQGSPCSSPQWSGPNDTPKYHFHRQFCIW